MNKSFSALLLLAFFCFPHLALAQQKTATTVAQIAHSKWEGFYVGINGGYSSNWAVDQTGAESDDIAGWLVGVQIGHDWQADKTVFGLVADFDSSTASNDYGTYKVSSSYLASVHGRLGQLMNDATLVYVLAGVAFSDLTDQWSGSVSNTQNGLGYTVGGGIEEMVSDHISLFGEYRFNHINKVEFSGIYNGTTAIVDGNEFGV
jgi:outer membrane immunogenic protein